MRISFWSLRSTRLGACAISGRALEQALVQALVQAFSQALVAAFAQALVRAFVPALVQAFVQTLVQAFAQALVWAFAQAFVLACAQAFVQALAQAFVQAFVQTRVLAFVQAFVWAFVRSSESSVGFRPGVSCVGHEQPCSTNSCWWPLGANGSGVIDEILWKSVAYAGKTMLRFEKRTSFRQYHARARSFWGAGMAAFV